MSIVEKDRRCRRCVKVSSEYFSLAPRSCQLLRVASRRLDIHDIVIRKYVFESRGIRVTSFAVCIMQELYDTDYTKVIKTIVAILDVRRHCEASVLIALDLLELKLPRHSISLLSQSPLAATIPFFLFHKPPRS